MMRPLRVLITAGPTHEPLDPVRFLSNRSTGVFGYTIAGEAARRGAAATLISGSTALPAPKGVRLIRVETASQMARAVAALFPSADVLFMTAAVADYRVARARAEKIQRKASGIVVRLVPTPDILAGLRKRNGQKLVGFCLESSRLIERAQRKLKAKRLDWIVANSIGPLSPFGRVRTSVVIVGRDGSRRRLAQKTKSEIARILLDLVEGAAYPRG